VFTWKDWIQQEQTRLAQVPGSSCCFQAFHASRSRLLGARRRSGPASALPHVVPAMMMIMMSFICSCRNKDRSR